MSKTNEFHVKNHIENSITIEEERKHYSPLALFFIKNGKLIFSISFLFSVTVFIIAIYLAMINVGNSSIVMYESNGVKVTFNGTDNSILNGTPITNEYANKIFDSLINVNTSYAGVVIKMDEIRLKDRTIIYFSDNTALIKYDNGSYSKISSVNNRYGIDMNGIIDSNAIVLDISGILEENKKFGISILKLSDGSMEITKDSTVFYIRNSDITNNNELFYANLSGVSLPVNKEDNKIYYSDGTIKDGDTVIVDGNRFGIIETKNIYGDIRIIYYENGYAEVIKGNLNIMVKNGGHIVSSDYSFEIVDNAVQNIDIKDVMDIKEIELNNTNTTNSHYIIVLEETSNYGKYDVIKRLDNKFINYNVYVNGIKNYNNNLDNNLKDSTKLEGVNLNNNTYLLYEGTLEKLSTTTVKLGLWIDYEGITNDYMDFSFIGTIKIYVESLS